MADEKKQRKPLPGVERPVRDRKELIDALANIENEGDAEIKEARRYIMRRAAELKAHGDIPVTWDADGNLKPGWDSGCIPERIPDVIDTDVRRDAETPR